MTRAVTRFVQFVVKVSKFCNLRCKYCYEFEELGRREAMSREQLLRMYQHIHDYYVEKDRREDQRTEVRFIWHGGEPLILEPAFYWQTFQDQRELFGDRLGLANIVQTNLTVLDEERIRLLKEGFTQVGVSVDLFGGLRVNIGGRESQPKVLENMEVLRQAGVRFACITVLTKKNLSRVKEIFRFYEKSGLGFRLLPLFDGAFDDQHEAYDVSTQEILEAYQTAVDLWMQSDRFVGANPISDHIQVVLGYLAQNTPPRYFNKREWTPTLLVNTNGDCYNYGDPYGQPAWCLGNLFTTPLGDILTSENAEKSIRALEARLAYNCTRCKYFGSCDGYPIAEDHSNCREVSPEGVRVCVLEKSLFGHIERRIREAGLVDESGRLAVGAEQARRLGMREGRQQSEVY